MNSSKETQRIEAFSDGVFAIAITLLILEIHVPTEKAGTTLLESLKEEWTSFLALLIGFFTLLVCWINHHFMFTMIHKSNSKLLLLNGLKLLVVTITPFSTALLAKNIESSWQNASISIYALNFTLMGVAMTALWFYAKSQGFVTAKSDVELKVINRFYAFASIISATIWLVTYVSIVGSLVLFCLMFLIYCFPERMVKWHLDQAAKKLKAPARHKKVTENPSLE